MSDIQRRIVTLFEARGAGQIRAALGEMRTGMGGYRSELRQVNRELGIVDRQVRALGTTARYALAGMTIFGSFQQIRNLGEFQAKLGEIQAIARGPGGVPLLDSQIDSLGQTLLRVSTNTATPIADLQSGVISLYSTIGDVPTNEAANMMEIIASVARTSQSGIEDTTNALLGMLNAFGRGTNELGKFGDQFFRVIQLSSGMPGHVYAQQLGRLQQSATLGRFTPEEMGGLAVSATRFGGSPAVSMRGLAQLMRTILDPANQQSEGVLASIGLPRSRRQQMGGYATLMEILRTAKARGIRGAGTRQDASRILGSVDEIGDQATNAQLGLSGEGARLLADIFTRSEGRGVAAILSQLLTAEDVAGTKNQTIETYKNQVAGLDESVRGVNDAMNDAMDYRRINQAGTALHNMGIELANAFGPVLNLGARGITGIEGFVRDNNEAAAYGGVGIIGALIAGRRAFGPGSLLRGAGAIKAVTDTAANAGGTGARGDSPTNPLWVAVAFSLSGGGAGGFMGRRGRGTGPYTPVPAPGPGGNAGRLGRLGRLARGAGYLSLVPLGIEAVEMTNENIWKPERERRQSQAMLRYFRSREGGIINPFSGKTLFGHHPERNPAEQRILDRLQQGYINESAAERMLRRVATPEQMRSAGLKFKATGELTVNVNTGQGRQRKTIPFELVPEFTQPAPTTRGTPKTYRGSGN